MAYDEDLAERIRALAKGTSGLSEKRMFGGLGFLVHGNLAVSASGQGGLLVRVDPGESDALVAGARLSRWSCAGAPCTAGCASTRST